MALTGISSHISELDSLGIVGIGSELKVRVSRQLIAHSFLQWENPFSDFFGHPSLGRMCAQNHLATHTCSLSLPSRSPAKPIQDALKSGVYGMMSERNPGKGWDRSPCSKPYGERTWLESRLRDDFWKVYCQRFFFRTEEGSNQRKVGGLFEAFWGAYPLSKGFWKLNGNVIFQGIGEWMAQVGFCSELLMVLGEEVEACCYVSLNLWPGPLSRLRLRRKAMRCMLSW